MQIPSTSNEKKHNFFKKNLKIAVIVLCSFLSPLLPKHEFGYASSHLKMISTVPPLLQNKLNLKVSLIYTFCAVYVAKDTKLTVFN